MRNLLIALFALLPLAGWGQMDKRVEVTKTYVPSVEPASKLMLQPDLKDTARMRPEIDYAVSPRALETSFQTRPFKAATIGYWGENKPSPLFLRVGGGYPANSLLDFYATTQHSSVGFVSAAVRHEGWWGKLGCGQDRARAIRTRNEVELSAGKYVGRHTLEGRLGYENRLYDRFLATGNEPNPYGGDRPVYGTYRAAFRFGDDFTDLSRTNFNVGVSAAHFRANPTSVPTSCVNAIPLQNGLGAEAALGRLFGSHLFRIDALYRREEGARELYGNLSSRLHAAVVYGHRGKQMDYRIGVRFDWLRNVREDADTYDEHSRDRYIFIPYLNLRYDPDGGRFALFVEMDGEVRDNSAASLAAINPFVSDGLWIPRFTIDYRAKAGADGTIVDQRVAYRMYAAYTHTSDALYWYVVPGDRVSAGACVQDRNVLSFHAELTVRPSNSFILTVGAAGYDFLSDSSHALGLPQFTAELGARYTHRKFSIGLRAEMQSVRHWSVAGAADGATWRRPCTVDLTADAEWYLSNKVTLFLQGGNLLNEPLDRFAFYPEYGANFTAGVRLDF